MTDPSHVSESHVTGRVGRCTACGHPVTEVVNGRCALCGQRVDVDADDVTSEDNTLYARALIAGEPGWRAMCKWIYGAGRSRLMHLGLLRASPASRRFARINLLLFTFAISAAVFANAGWHVVYRGPGALANPATPSGKGWARVAERDPSAQRTFADQVVATDLWWNAPRAIVSAAVVWPTVLLMGFVVLWLVGARGQKAMRIGDRDSGRLRCAVHYSTAWMHFLSLAVLIELVRPLAKLFQVRGWSAMTSPAVVDVPAVLIGLVGVLMWWFWLIRLGDTAPKELRRAVSRQFVLWTPLLVIGVGGAAAFGVHTALPRLATALNLNW